MATHQPGYLEKRGKKISLGIMNAKPRKSTSQQELNFFELLVGVHGPTVVHKHRIERINHEFDFYVPELHLIVEFDGDYWHGNGKLHELDPRMKRQYRIDESLTRCVEKHGYAIRRVWASEALNYPEMLRKI